MGWGRILRITRIGSDLITKASTGFDRRPTCKTQDCTVGLRSGHGVHTINKMSDVKY